MNYFFAKPFVLFVLTFICVILESCVYFDQTVQALFYINGDWVLTSAGHQHYRWFFYDGGKKFVSIIAGCVAFIAVFSWFMRKKYNKWKKWCIPSIFVLLCLAIIPALISAFKVVTGIPCPKELLIYGGTFEHIGFLDTLFQNGFDYQCRGRCYPAAHASGGFALLSLYFLPVNQNLRVAFFCFGMLCGWVMGVYQMIRGDHFMSHTLTTMFLSLLVIAMLAKIMKMEAFLTRFKD